LSRPLRVLRAILRACATGLGRIRLVVGRPPSAIEIGC